jgi:hypothetical protein
VASEDSDEEQVEAVGIICHTTALFGNVVLLTPKRLFLPTPAGLDLTE